MRTEIKKDLYQEAKEALRDLISTFQSETTQLTCIWEKAESAFTTYICWCAPEEYENGYYGDNPGLYLKIGEYYIYLPNSTRSYCLFYDSIVKLHAGENYVESVIPAEIILDFKSGEIASYMFTTYFLEHASEMEIIAAKSLSKELMGMLCNEEMDSLEFYEGDEERNYCVGFKELLKIDF